MEERLKSKEQEVKFHPIVVETDSDSEISKDNNLPVIRSEQDNIFDLAKQEPSKNESVVSTESIHEIPIFGITPEITQEYKERLEKMRRWGYVLPRLLGFKDKNYRLNYTDNTNYLDALPYEACCAGPRYWQLITNLLEKHEVLKDEEPTVLEFGSATGNLLEILSDKYQTAHLFGVDIVEEASKKAKTKVPNATIIVGDLNNPEVVDCVFGLEKLQKVDLIIAMDVIEHMDSKEKQLVLVKNIFEALKPGGWAIIGMPERPSKSDGVVKRIFKTL